ncbi:retropepsin-like aspartic protease [Sphingomonas sp. LT1P40]|uniref:retropepsin-like aspartic protease n=1 Tax=Alteristakelama amylovorans TaxID=3096166 RepID=UPI002FC82996
MDVRAPMTLFLALLALVTPVDRVRAAPPVSTLATDTEARWVPFELTPGNQIRFRTLLNGRWVDAILDTGVSDSAVSARFARSAGMKPLVSGRADAIGGSVSLSWTSLQRVEVGGLVRTGGRIAIIDADPRVTGSAPVDLFVGSDLLAAHALEIDYDAQRFRLLLSGRMPFRGVTAPLSLADRTGLYLSELNLGGRRHRAVIVDTGDGSMVTLTRSAWRGSEREAGPVTTAIAYGLGGMVETEVAILPTLRLASLTARDVELRVEPDTGFSGRKGAAGRIGSGLLRRHRVLLDPGAGRMILAPAARADWPVSRSTSGLMLAQEGPRLRVLHVMRGSPAAAAGWRAGAEICGIDGSAIPALYTGSALASWSIGIPGRTVRLSLCDGAERNLTLARFY